MADVEGLGQALEALSHTLPDVPSRLEPLLQEAVQTRTAVEGFLASIEARLTEAGETVPRLEAHLRALARLSTDETLRLDQDRDLPTLLNDPGLALEETVGRFTAGLAQRRTSDARTALQGWDATKDERGQVHRTAFNGAQDGFTAGRERLTQSSAATAQRLQALQNMVEVTRSALTEEVERFGAVLESQQTAAARDVDEVRKDLEGLEAAMITRVERVREAVRQDTDDMVETTRERMEELRQLAERAVKQLGAALEELDSKLKEAEDEAEETRESLASQFDDLRERLEPLRHVLEGVREAAHSVGIPL